MIEGSSERLVKGEVVRRLQDVRVAARSKDLLSVALPFGLVDTIDPIFDFQDDAAILVDYTRAAGVVEEALSFFQSKSA